jgi:hypothetical protein
MSYYALDDHQPELAILDGAPFFLTQVHLDAFQTTSV